MADSTNPTTTNPTDIAGQISNNGSNSTPSTALEGEIVLPNINLDNTKPTEPITLPDVSLQNTYNPPAQEELNTMPATPATTTPSEQVFSASETVSNETSTATEPAPGIVTEQPAVVNDAVENDVATTTEPVVSPEIAKPENNVAPVETTVPAENVLNQETPGNDDPFDGLNIVFNQPTPPQTPVAAQNISNEPAKTQEKIESKAFVDPFLNSDTKIADDNTISQAGLNVGASKSQDTINTNAASLDSLLTTINTPPTATAAADGLVGKKKKMLIAASGLIGVAVLVAASYLVFTTMYPQETDTLAKNLQGNVAGTDTTTTTEQPTQGDATNAPESTTAEEPKKEPEEELPAPAPDPVDTSANQFGQDDELPNAAPNDTTTTTEEKPAGETNPTDIAPEITDALKTIEGYVDKCKQLLALAKEKNDTASIRAIAGVLKSVKDVQRKINEKTYTTYSTDIEKPLSELNFNLDQITAKLIGK